MRVTGRLQNCPQRQRRQHGFFFILLLLLTILPPPAMGRGKEPVGQTPVPAGHHIQEIPIYDARDLGLEPMLPQTLLASDALSEEGRGSPVTANTSLATIDLSGPTYLRPGAGGRYEITLANYESITRTFRLSDTLPSQLAYVPDPTSDLQYDPATHTLSWTGALAPGHLEMIIEPAAAPLPYLDLADFGAPDLCQTFREGEGQCQDSTVTFNLGVNGYAFPYYGRTLRQITLSSNGLALGNGPAADTHNQWLPATSAPNLLLAGLWRDNDLTHTGRWHAAIVSGLIAGHDVFYAQWHNAPHADNPNSTARHAIALVLDRDDDHTVPSLSGHAFFIYDNISEPAALIAEGYTIGAEDALGQRGVTYAYAPCCGDTRPPQGHPPDAGATLHLRPVLFVAQNAYSRTFTYQAVVNAGVPQTVANTAFARSDSPDPALARSWSTHYLFVCRQLFLPLHLGSSQEAP